MGQVISGSGSRGTCGDGGAGLFGAAAAAAAGAAAGVPEIVEAGAGGGVSSRSGHSCQPSASTLRGFVAVVGAVAAGFVVLADEEDASVEGSPKSRLLLFFFE